MQTNRVGIMLGGLLGAYFMGYCVARLNIFHGVETYPEGKGAFRKIHIAKIDHPPGEGWEYQFFFPAIKIEEALFNR